MKDDVLDFVNQNDGLQVCIRCHLLVENYLIDIIECKLPVKKEFNVDRLNFKQKVELCIALGGISSDMKGALLYVNRLRNKFAHNLNYQILDHEVNELRALLSKDGDQLFNSEPYKSGTNVRKLGGLYVIIYSQLNAWKEISCEST